MPARQCRGDQGLCGRLHRRLTIKALFDNIIKIALLGAIAYGIWYWQSTGGQAEGSTAHAESACRDAITSRFAITRVSISRVTENSNGYTIRASGTRSNGGTARLVCLTTPNGSVRDVSIEHR
jgi:hypothetical protein